MASAHFVSNQWKKNLSQLKNIDSHYCASFSGFARSRKLKRKAVKKVKESQSIFMHSYYMQTL